MDNMYYLTETLEFKHVPGNKRKSKKYTFPEGSRVIVTDVENGKKYTFPDFDNVEFDDSVIGDKIKYEKLIENEVVDEQKINEVCIDDVKLDNEYYDDGETENNEEFERDVESKYNPDERKCEDKNSWKYGKTESEIKAEWERMVNYDNNENGMLLAILTNEQLITLSRWIAMGASNDICIYDTFDKFQTPVLEKTTKYIPNNDMNIEYVERANVYFTNKFEENNDISIEYTPNNIKITYVDNVNNNYFLFPFSVLKCMWNIAYNKCTNDIMRQNQQLQKTEEKQQ